MNSELIFEMAWKSCIVAGLTLLVLALLKSRSAAERSWIAHAGLVAILLLPISAISGLNWQVGAIPSISTFASVETTKAAPPKIESQGSQIAPRSTASSGPFPATPPTQPWRVASWLYFGPMGLLALLLVVAIFRLHLLRRRSQVLVDQHWATALASAQNRMNFKTGTALLVSDELRSPISWGVVRPIILLDRRAAADTEQAEAIIAHELAHLARLDWAMLLLGRLVTAIFWFNPLVWKLARNSYELSEQAVDDTVLRQNIDSTDYAKLLIGTARHDNGAILLAANGVAGSGTLTSRVKRVLDGSGSRRPAKWSWIAACSAGTFLVAAPLCAIRPINESSVATTSVRLDAQQTGPGDLVAWQANQTASEQRRSISDLTGSHSGAGLGSPGTTALVKDHSAIPLASTAEAGALNNSPLKSVEPLVSLSLLNSRVSRGGSSAVPRRSSRATAPVAPEARPLLVAAWYGRLDMVRALLDAGADIDATVGRGEANALMKASRQGHLDLVKYLLDRGANINIAVPGAGNALLQASHGGHENVVRYLIARGANVHSINSNESPLGSAVYMGHANIVKMLIDAGAGGVGR